MLQGQLGPVAIVRNRQALNTLQGEKRQAVSGCAAVERPRDIRVFETGQNLTLVTEAGQGEVAA